MQRHPDSLRAEDQPSWVDVVRHTVRGETVAVTASGEHPAVRTFADVVPSGELDRLRETIDVLADSELGRQLRDGLADITAGRTAPAEQIAEDLRHREVDE